MSSEIVFPLFYNNPTLADKHCQPCKIMLITYKFTIEMPPETGSIILLFNQEEVSIIKNAIVL